VSLGDRTEALERLAASRAEPFDVVVIGGGITGAGVALDAASRGLSVGLIERNDFASGTSSKSSKLVHGGLRYLERRDFALVREASTERELLARLAPHLVEPIPFVIPVSRRATRAKFGVGLWTYDALASFRNLRVHRYLDREETETALPALPKGKLRGGFIFYDSKTDDARLVIEVLHAARRFGANVANHVEARHLEGSEDVCEVEALDRVAGETFTIRARRVIAAAGVWTDAVERLADPEAALRVKPSKGIHLVFDAERLRIGSTAALIPDADRRRMIFVIPWLDSVVVGTTDTPYDGDIDSPSVEDNDRAYVLDAVNASFDVSLTENDIAGAYAGLRPLIAGKAGETADLSRRHSVYDIAPGIIGITGGKLTTYRRMAKDAVDRIADAFDDAGKCRTAWIRLGTSNLTALEDVLSRRARRLGLSDKVVAHLIRSYGNRSLQVLDGAAGRDLLDPVAPDALPISAEAVYCVEHEMAITLSDFLSRRTRLSLTDKAAGIGRGSLSVATMASELGWSRSEQRAQIDAHRTSVEAERGLAVGESSRPRPPAEATG
jgi:glycerol-3-phosphate dehydrogenase